MPFPKLARIGVFPQPAKEQTAREQWFPDGKRVLISGNEPGKGTRFYVQDVGEQVASGVARPVTPEGTRDGRLSADGTLVLARGADGKYFVYPIAGGEPRPVPVLTDTDVLAQWSTDGRSVLVYRRAEIPCRLERVELATGRRTLFKEFAPGRPHGTSIHAGDGCHRRSAVLRTRLITRYRVCLSLRAGIEGCAPV